MSLLAYGARLATRSRPAVERDHSSHTQPGTTRLVRTPPTGRGGFTMARGEMSHFVPGPRARADKAQIPRLTTRSAGLFDTQWLDETAASI